MSTFVLFLKVTHYKVKIKDENVKKVKVKVHGKNCNSLQVKVLTKVTKYCNEVIVLRYNPALHTDLHIKAYILTYTHTYLHTYIMGATAVRVVRVRTLPKFEPLALDPTKNSTIYT